MKLTPEQEAHLYTINPDAAAATKMIRQYIGASYEKSLELMQDYAALPSGEVEKVEQLKLL